MRKIEDVLVGFVATIYLCLILYISAQAYIYGEPVSAMICVFRVSMSIVSVLLVVASFLDGRKNDETDPWSEEKKENGRFAYLSFVFFIIFLFVSMAAFADNAWPVGIITSIVAVALMAFGAISIETMTSYIKAVLPKELSKLIRKEVSDYIEVDKLAITFRRYGEGHEVTFKKGDVEFQIVIDENSLEQTCFTTKGRTVKLFKVDQWLIVLYDTPKKVRVFESKVHPN